MGNVPDAKTCNTNLEHVSFYLAKVCFFLSKVNNFDSDTISSVPAKAASWLANLTFRILLESGSTELKAQLQNQPHFCVPLDQEIRFQKPVQEFKSLQFLPKQQGYALVFSRAKHAVGVEPDNTMSATKFPVRNQRLSLNTSTLHLERCTGG